MNSLHALLKEMEEYAQLYKVPIIREDGADILVNVISAAKPVSILEIGTAIGYSTILMAQASPVAKIITIEKDEERFRLANEYISRAGFSHQINALLGDAEELLPTLTEKFDAVFIDAAKGHYLSNLKAILSNLEAGAVIIADNILFRGLVNSQTIVPRRFRTIVKRLEAYLNFVQNDPDFETKIYVVGDGIAVSHYGGKNL